MLVLSSMLASSVTALLVSSGAGAAAQAPVQTSVAIPGTALSVDLVEVKLTEASTLWFGRTEIPWEVLDVFVHGLDEESASSPEIDAITRPSKPYISMDRGFGHHGYPAISVSHANAVAFCQWLSTKTGRSFRLPTRSEWMQACERADIDASRRADHAWSAENAKRKTHPVGTRAADAAGLHDMLGNAGEWVSDGADTFVVMGGSYRDPAERLGCSHQLADDPAWNASDPQIPRSIWWLADGGFIGFRVVCDPAPLGEAAPKTPTPPTAPTAPTEPTPSTAPTQPTPPTAPTQPAVPSAPMEPEKERP